MSSERSRSAKSSSKGGTFTQSLFGCLSVGSYACILGVILNCGHARAQLFALFIIFVYVCIYLSACIGVSVLMVQTCSDSFLRRTNTHPKLSIHIHVHVCRGTFGHYRGTAFGIAPLFYSVDYRFAKDQPHLSGQGRGDTDAGTTTPKSTPSTFPSTSRSPLLSTLRLLPRPSRRRDHINNMIALV